MHHTADFSIDRPNGSGDCLLIIFKTDALLTLGGRDMTVSPDTAIIYSKGSPQYYRAICGSYVNHFLHYDMDDIDSDSRIIYDKLLVPRRIGDAEELLRMLSREQLSTSPNKDDYSSALIKMLLMKISEQSDEPRGTQIDPHAELLDSLRADMYANPGQFTSVAQLAERVRLSPSHFQQLYRSRFGISSYEDLLSAKIRTAQYYLSSTALTVREIANLCGYENEVCFMHRFKERTGKAPGAYRKLINGEYRG
ncbi:transcriptional regulator, AraC family [Ruminococcus albus 7 = DSM 20455]|uniref:Transcriptional regulator, AraC family n=2 Tax=Ruminococcus albus TaxID=1264 RepID=E6UJ63_RUMA7|nr:transcriptional regulator, AraC family [Ruminococcus albus 7 = DSM 20455]